MCNCIHGLRNVWQCDWTDLLGVLPGGVVLVGQRQLWVEPAAQHQLQQGLLA